MRPILAEPKLVAERTKAQIRDYKKRLPKGALAKRVAALAKVRTEEGYMAEWARGKDGGFTLVENHCPICDAAQACQGLCAGELELFETVLSATLERVEFRPGDRGRLSPMDTNQELIRKGAPGLLSLLVIVAALVGGVVLIALGGENEDPALIIPGVLIAIVSFVCLFGLCIVNPNAAKVLVLFGKYAGTIKSDGWYWVNPFNVKTRMSLRVRNFETERLKVNDLDGNPIEIAAVVVWKVVETAEASFEVDDYVHFVHVQSESALRQMATHYHYDTHDESELSLRGSTDSVAKKLGEEIQARLETAGVSVVEARISHLAYAPEIAEAMLRRQQAGAIIAARQKIVEGAVGMVEQALDDLAQKKIVELDGVQRARLVSNLLVVLCSEHATQPVVNAGSAA